MAKILIAGCGYVGVRLGLALSQTHTVYGLRRHPNFPQAIHPIAADVTKPESLTALPEVDYVFYMVAAGEYSESAYYDAYVNGLQNLLGALAKDSIKHLYFVSSTGVYAQHNGEWVDEKSLADNPNFSGQALLQGEAIALNSGIHATCVRFAGIYGPNRTRLIHSILSNKAAFNTEDVYTNSIHVDDCVGVLQHLLSLNAPEKYYIACDSAPTKSNEKLAWLAKQLGKHIDNEASKTSPLRGNKRCSNQRLLQSGYVFKYPDFKSGYRALIDRD